MKTGLAGIFVIAASSAFGQTLFTFPNGKGGNVVAPSIPVVEACKFTVGSSSVSINQLGHETGFLAAGPRSVAVWDYVTGAVMGQTQIDGTEALDNGYHYRQVNPIMLQAGRTYVIGALHGSGAGASYYHNTNTATLVPGLTDGGAVYWITNAIGPAGTWNASGPRYYTGNAKLGPPPHIINFTMLLSDFVPSPSNYVPITLNVYQSGLIYTKTVSMGSAGVFGSTVPNNYTGITRFAFDGHTFLRRCITVVLPPTSSNGGVITLINGDADNSGEIDAADIDFVIRKFGTTPSSAGWTTQADLDRSDEVDSADIDIVIANFGAVDDPL